MRLAILGVLAMVCTSAQSKMTASELPKGSAPAPVSAPHFPDSLHAFVWRNWGLAPIERMARVVGAQPADLKRMGKAMGLSGPPPVPQDRFRRSSTTIIKHNWQLLPYEQLLELLDWTPEEMAYHLREDDFLFVKLGNLKPECMPIRYQTPSPEARSREAAICAVVKEAFPDGVGAPKEPPFSFVSDLSKTPQRKQPASASGFAPRFCYSYFGATGDPLLGPSEDVYPDGLLARLAASGVDGVWLPGVLYTLAPFPWEPGRSAGSEKRLANLSNLVARAKRHGIGVYLYLNEPRAMPVSFFEGHPELKGVVEGDYAAMCTSNPDVRRYIRDSVAAVCRAVPELKGFFSISASENLTNCFSHHNGTGCARCDKRTAAEVIAEVNTLFRDGIRDAGSKAELIVWDWGWQDGWAKDAIAALPKDVSFMSVSEWDLPIERGGVKTTIGEYSLSAVGPGPRALRHWEAAREQGLKTIAKVQVGTTWELGAVPYIPVVENVARHMSNLRDAKVDGLMLSWTLGGYPSPSLEVAAEMGRARDGGERPTPAQAMETVAVRRFGADLAGPVVEAWHAWSEDFKEYPFSGGLIYTAPVHVGPSNPLWTSPTGYAATMVGFPYDDLTSWRGPYPPDVFIRQFGKLADGFDAAADALSAKADTVRCDAEFKKELARELDVARACSIHYRSTANQASFVLERNALAAAGTASEARPHIDALEGILREEVTLAKRMYALQSRDSRLGYEASNQYYYLPQDLAEKVLNCQDLLSRWLPEQRSRFGIANPPARD